MEREHVLVALVENKPGVMQRISGMFAKRGFNIETITVGPTESQELSRMTLVVKGDERVLEQVQKQLNKLVEVIKVSDVDPKESVIRELCLIKVHTPDQHVRAQVVQYAHIFRAHVVDVSPESIMIELTGDSDKINAFIDLMRGFGIKELARTGTTAMQRGAKIIEPKK